MFPNLQFELFFVCLIVKSFKKILIYSLAINSIISYHTTIILNIKNKVAYYIKFRLDKVLLV